MSNIKLMSVRDVSEFLGVSESTVRRMRANGELNATKARGQVRFLPQDVRNYLASNYSGNLPLAQSKETHGA